MDRNVRLPYLMRVACRLAERGMHVFPLHPGTKRPALRSDWEGAASVDIDRIQRWWRTKPFNIGIATGPSGLLVVDLDAPKDRLALHGRQSLSSLARAAGEVIPRNTLTVVTPGGGQHLYFRVPEGETARCTVGRLGRNVDTRGAGGYIVGPASVVNHRRYRLVRAVAPLPLPRWIADALQPASGPEPAAARPAAGPPSPGPYDAQSALRQAIADVERARTGTRNHTLFKAAARLDRYIVAGRLTEHEVRTALEGASAVHVGVEGFTATEVRRTIASALRRPGPPTTPWPTARNRDHGLMS